MCVNSAILTEQHGDIVSLLDDLLQDPGVDLLDPVGQVHRLQTGEELQDAVFVHQVSCESLRADNLLMMDV